ncbi:MAG: hypothetical protein JWP58_242 [Hymenobacter sp.]|nr:hypothetical protein [Hymenobacter sp.]
MLYLFLLLQVLAPQQSAHSNSSKGMPAHYAAVSVPPIQSKSSSQVELQVASTALQAAAASMQETATIMRAPKESQSTPPAVWATLAAAILALLSSLNSTRISRKTAREVADLSTKTSREVADLSSQTARDTAGIAAQTAKELKKEDYKHDFYKKLIQKRLDAWTEAESLLPFISAQISVGDEESILFGYFENGDLFDEILDKINSCMVLSVWLGKDYANYVEKFHQKLYAIRVKCQIAGELLENNSPAIDDELLIQAGRDNYEETTALLHGYIKILGQQITVLHDMDSFFEQLSLLGGHTKVVDREYL